MTDLDLYYTRRLDQEQALAGAALLDPACADLLLAELNLREVVCSVSQAVLRTLESVRDEQPIRYAVEPALDLVLEELAMTGELARLEELGGRDAVLELVSDRDQLRLALASLRKTVVSMAPLSEEPVVLLAAEELGADQDYHDNLDRSAASRDSLPLLSVKPYRHAHRGSPVPSSRQSQSSTRSTP